MSDTTNTTAPTETWHKDGFPFEELHQYPNLQSALAAGCKEENLWSICEGDDPEVWIYGPPHHYVNLVGIAHTAEARDGLTYYVDDFNA